MRLLSPFRPPTEDNSMERASGWAALCFGHTARRSAPLSQDLALFLILPHPFHTPLQPTATTFPSSSHHAGPRQGHCSAGAIRCLSRRRGWRDDEQQRQSPGFYHHFLDSRPARAHPSPGTNQTFVPMFRMSFRESYRWMLWKRGEEGEGRSVGFGWSTVTSNS